MKEKWELAVQQNQLLEIYKIQAQLTNSISNRRTTTNRFYQVLLSGLIIILTALLQNKSGEPVQLLGGLSIESLMV